MTLRRSLVGVLAVAVGALVTTSGCSALPGGDGGGSDYRLTAMFPSAVGLYPAGDVKVMGVGVGTVDAVEIDDDIVRVEMTIRSEVPLPADVRATIEPLTLIGERNVVLFPPWDAAMAEAGDPRAGDGDVIPVERTKVPVEPDEALAAFDELARSLDPDIVGGLVTDSASVLNGLGDDLGRAIDQAAGITTSLAEVDDQLVAAADGLHSLAASLVTRDAQLAALVRGFSDVTTTLAEERDGIRTFLTSLVELTRQGNGILAAYGGQLPEDLSHLAALAMVLGRNAGAAQALIGSLPAVAEGIAEGFQPETGGVYLRASLTPTLISLLDVFRDLAVLPARAGR